MDHLLTFVDGQIIVSENLLDENFDDTETVLDLYVTTIALQKSAPTAMQD